MIQRDNTDRTEHTLRQTDQLLAKSKKSEKNLEKKVEFFRFLSLSARLLTLFLFRSNRYSEMRKFLGRGKKDDETAQSPPLSNSATLPANAYTHTHTSINQSINQSIDRSIRN
jgi:hypothetical protein